VGRVRSSVARSSVIFAEPRAPHFVHLERRATCQSGVSLPPYFGYFIVFEVE
jgi:hypothetical protein